MNLPRDLLPSAVRWCLHCLTRKDRAMPLATQLPQLQHPTTPPKVTKSWLSWATCAHGGKLSGSVIVWRVTAAEWLSAVSSDAAEVAAPSVAHRLLAPMTRRAAESRRMALLAVAMATSGSYGPPNSAAKRLASASA